LRKKEEKRATNKEILSFWQKEAARKNTEQQRKLEEYHAPEKHVGASGLVSFDGEDVCKAERETLQKRQMRMWVSAQMVERKRQEEERRNEETRYAKQRQNMIQKQDEAEALRKQQEKQTLKEVEQYNIKRAQMKRQEESHRVELDKLLEEKETGNLLSKNPESLQDSRNVSNPRRYRPDHFRGLDADTLRAIREAQEDQMQERRRRQREEKQEDQFWGKQQEALFYISNHAYHAEAERRKQAEAKVLAIQEEQALEKRLREKEQRKRESCEPGLGPDFFNRFGQSHR